MAARRPRPQGNLGFELLVDGRRLVRLQTGTGAAVATVCSHGLGTPLPICCRSDELRDSQIRSSDERTQSPLGDRVVIRDGE